MSRPRLFTILLSGLLAAASAVVAGIWIVGSLLIHPAQSTIGKPPADFPASDVVFASSSGALIHGWFVRGHGRGAVLLLHGVCANRLAMLDRGRFLYAAGYSVLLIDLQASGESVGSAITFGYLESRDAVAAVTVLKTLAPGKPIGVYGTSMGGAAVVLADPPLKIDAMILEQVYPTLRQAIDDRLPLHAGSIGLWIAPLLLSTVKPHLGFSLDAMRPVDHMGTLSAPKLLIAGDADQHTRIDESLAMLHAAPAPKDLWIIHGARHVDLYRFSGGAYKTRVLAYFDKWLRKPIQ